MKCVLHDKGKPEILSPCVMSVTTHSDVSNEGGRDRSQEGGETTAHDSETGKLVLDWKKRQSTRAAARYTIETVLDELPRAYTPDLYQQKCDVVLDWTEETLSIERGIVWQRVDETKTEGSARKMKLASSVLERLQNWKYPKSARKALKRWWAL